MKKKNIICNLHCNVCQLCSKTGRNNFQVLRTLTRIHLNTMQFSFLLNIFHYITPLWRPRNITPIFLIIYKIYPVTVRVLHSPYLPLILLNLAT